MHLQNGALRLSATDLSNFLGCKHRTALDLAVQMGRREEPQGEPDELLQMLWARGLDHEKQYVDWLKGQGLGVTDLSEVKSATELVAATEQAMRNGAQVIVQGGLRDGQWFGKPDILMRVDIEGGLGGWGYEVYDTKLSRKPKAGTILQLSLYSAMVARVQGAQPRHFYVVSPRMAQGKVAPEEVSKRVKGPDTMMMLEYRVNDYAAYFRLIRARMEETTALDPDAVFAANYPDPCDHCAICRWDQTCDAKRRTDDHISLLAGIGRGQRPELAVIGITTRRQLGETWPLPAEPKRGSVDTYERLHKQAALQLRSTRLKMEYELRPIVAFRAATDTEPVQLDEGLCCLPEPSPGDIFLDFEGDPYSVEGGREYLTGIITVENGKQKFEALWAFTNQDEQAAYERLMDMIAERRKTWPGMHVYHYAPYEVTALRKLRLRYESRGGLLDQFLEGKVFVDLYAVVRQGLLIGTESYSIKNLEPLYDFVRKVELRNASRHRNAIEVALQRGEDPDDETKGIVQGYNEDDCVSTLLLRDWLEKVRTTHGDIPRPTMPPEQEEKINEHQLAVNAVRETLLTGISADVDKRTDAEQRARWVLSYLLDYHRGEYLATVWEYWRLRELPEEQLIDEPQAILGLQFVERVGENVDKKGKPTGVVTDRYTWPQQEMEIEKGDLKLRDGGTLGTIVELDRIARIVDVKKQKKQKENHPRAVFSFTYIATAAHEKSLLAIGRRVADDGAIITNPGSPDLAARRLLLGHVPSLKGRSAR